ncbi:alginate lyase [Opitutaceae bacterium TAV4]|nr:alginate lyase [Opitutaceae bacterium TAV4]RRK01864.1 alginate lyase [Opitutaceae bacterium TAV3]
MKKKRTPTLFTLWLTAICINVSITDSVLAATAATPTASTAASAPRVFALPPVALATARERVAANDPLVREALAKLRSDADKALAMKPPSVMDKTKVAASGDKHDYYSVGPYWWPDPSKPDGLPYIRRDGQHNPERNDGTDTAPFGAMCRAVETLALAWHLTGHEPYAAHAARLARTWFLDPATRMNPHLEYGQAIPGRTNGRGIGIIETRALIYFTDGIALIANSPAWTPADNEGLHAWLGAYLDWLLHSKNGLDEKKEHNNHGTWYDAQVAQLALILGRTELARATLSSALQTRLATQIEPDGSQPHELARTLSLTYSTMNLAGFMTLAQQAAHVGVDWWRHTTPDGRSLRQAIRFMVPFAAPDKPWIKTDLKPADREPIRMELVLARIAYGDDEPAFRDEINQLRNDAQFARERWNLFAP